MASQLLDKITADIKEFMKAKDMGRLTALRMLHSEIKNLTVNAGKEPTDAEVVQAVNKGIKQRQDAFEQYKTAGRQDLADKEQLEIDLFKRYQPKQLDRAEVEAIVRACMAETGIAGKKETGKLMQAVMAKVKGQVDGKVVSDMVRLVLPD